MLLLTHMLLLCIFVIVWLAVRIEVNTVHVGDVAKTDQLNILVAKWLADGATVRLYTANSAGSAAAEVVGSFTEAAFVGYAGVALAIGSNTGIDGNDYDEYSFASVAFQPTGSSGLPVTVLGYYVTNNTSGHLIWSQPFASPFVFSSTANIASFNPIIGCGQL